MKLRNMLNTPSAFHNWKQRNGYVQVNGTVSGYIRAMRLKRKINEDAITPEVLEVMQKLGFTYEKISMSILKPFDYSDEKLTEIEKALNKGIIYALVHVCSSRKKAESLTPKIKELLNA